MYKEECVLKNKIFHPSVMYYILSTIVSGKTHELKRFNKGVYQIS